MKGLPLWATPPRQAHLIRLYAQAREFYEEDGRVVPDNNEAIELAIYIWKALDREEREEAWRREKRKLHALPKILRRGPFDSIAREIYLAERPLWKIEAVGVGAFTFSRVTKVEIPALGKVIWVDLAGVDGSLSKNARRKLVRYRKGKLPSELEESVFARCQRAVAQYLAS
ncbi:MAG: hypothetical protein KJ624_02520 [Chloroflexi bacterium]|nr:hypothetical protein [Chloroflexota bacterium]